MTPTRWTLIAVAALAGAAALFVATRAPDEAPAPPLRAAAEPLPLNPPTPRQVSAASRPMPGAAPQPARRPVPMPASAPPIGAEGYGPHIERAAEGRDPQQAWAAVQWLQACAVNETLRQSAEALRNRGVAPEFMTQRMVELDAEGRRCQTVTTQHHALEPALALQAMRGGVAGAAAAFAAATPPAQLAAAERQEVVAAMRRDATSGEPNPALGAATAPQAWDLPDTERLTYLYVYAELQGEAAAPTARALLARGLVPLKAPPTPAQVQQAQTEARTVLARWRVVP